jgi:hypothetical protein
MGPLGCFASLGSCAQPVLLLGLAHVLDAFRGLGTCSLVGSIPSSDSRSLLSSRIVLSAYLPVKARPQLVELLLHMAAVAFREGVLLVCVHANSDNKTDIRQQTGPSA